jgi:hypothetical protein
MWGPKKLIARFRRLASLGRARISEGSQAIPSPTPTRRSLCGRNYTCFRTTRVRPRRQRRASPRSKKSRIIYSRVARPDARAVIEGPPAPGRSSQRNLPIELPMSENVSIATPRYRLTSCGRHSGTYRLDCSVLARATGTKRAHNNVKEGKPARFSEKAQSNQTAPAPNTNVARLL